MTVSLYPGSTDRAGQDRTEWNVALAVEAPHLGLSDRREIGRAGIDRDAGQQHRQFEMLQAGRLLHHVFAGQLIAALLQYLNGCRGNRLAVDGLLIGLVATRVILVHEREPRFVARIGLPLGVGRVLEGIVTDDALGVFEAGRLQRRTDRRSNPIQNVQRLPSDFGRLPDRQGTKSGNCDGDEDIAAYPLHLNDLRVDGRVGSLVGRLDLDQSGRLIGEPVHQPLEIVLAEIVVLIEYADLGIGLVLQNIAGVNAALCLVADEKAHGPGMALGVVPLSGAGAEEQLRHSILIHVVPDRAVGGGADRAGDEQNVVSLYQLARHLDRLGWRIAVVNRNEGDLAPVHTTLIVDHLEIGGHRYRNGAGVRERAAIGAGVADLDLAVGDPGAVLLGGSRRPGAQ